MSGRQIIKQDGNKRSHSGPAMWIVKCLQCSKESRVESGRLRRGAGCRCSMAGRPKKWAAFSAQQRQEEWTVLRSQTLYRRQARIVNHGVANRGYKDAGKITSEGLRKQWLLSGELCGYCSVPLTLDPHKFNTVQWDHATPLSREGKNEDENIVSTLSPVQCFQK